MIDPVYGELEFAAEFDAMVESAVFSAPEDPEPPDGPRMIDEADYFDHYPSPRMSRVDALEWELWAGVEQDEAERHMLQLKAPAWAFLAPGGELAAALEQVRPQAESPMALIEVMKAAMRLTAWSESIKVSAMAAFYRQRQAESDQIPRPSQIDSHGRPVDPERSWMAEIAAALKLAPSTVAGHVDTALRLTSVLSATHTALRCGAISLSKAIAISDATRTLTPGQARAVESHVLQRAATQTHANLGKSLRRQVAKYDAKNEADRHREAQAERDIRLIPLPDGMAGLWIVNTADKIQQMWIVIQALADLAKRPNTGTFPNAPTPQPTTPTAGARDNAAATPTANCPSSTNPANDTAARAAAAATHADRVPDPASPAAGTASAGPAAANAASGSPADASTARASATGRPPPAAATGTGAAGPGAAAARTGADVSGTTAAPTLARRTDNHPTTNLQDNSNLNISAHQKNSTQENSVCEKGSVREEALAQGNSADQETSADREYRANESSAYEEGSVRGEALAQGNSAYQESSARGESPARESSARQETSADGQYPAHERSAYQESSTHSEDSVRESSVHGESSADEGSGGQRRSAGQRRADVTAELFEFMLWNGLDWLGRRLPDQHRRRPHIEVLTPASTLLGLDDDPCELTGYGPITAEMARRIATDGTWRRILTDPTNGSVLEASTTRHDPGSLVSETLLAAHPVCDWINCNRAARECDRDHGTPFAQTGTTTLADLRNYCELHHIIKDTPAWGWKATNNPDGSTTLTTPTGHRYTSVPPRPGQTSNHPPSPDSGQTLSHQTPGTGPTLSRPTDAGQTFNASPTRRPPEGELPPF